jgi:1-deoxy-D-xylulose-5-phosphate reductoisomerase
MRKNIVILGSTGSIGRNALKVLVHLNHFFKVSGLVAHSNWSLLKEQAKEFQPKKVALIDLTAAERCQSALRKQKIKFYRR